MSTQQRMSVRPDAGFTLIEVLVAIAIVMVVGGAATLGYFEFFAGAQQDAARTEIRTLAQAVQQFKLKEQSYPKESDWPRFLTEGSKRFKRPYLADGADVEDPWGNEYKYVNRSGNKDFDIISYGSDGQPGGQDDAADISWQEMKKGN